MINYPHTESYEVSQCSESMDSGQSQSEAFSSMQQKIKFVSEFATFIRKIDIVTMSSPSSNNDAEGKKMIKDLLINTINSDVQFQLDDQAWYQKESRKFQKLTSF